ncbi:MAM and LDL-receptor class A domain-containing protein 2 isoform X3 [Nematostella vectensis]|nr:MAM and LDL-receptor class A domain-containing protein 2 isoform X3 [Nematostella vectensis]
MYQGDIILDPEQERMIKNRNRNKRNAVRSKSSLWTSRVIPIYVPSHMSHIEQNLADAIVQLQSHTCLKFVHYSGQANFIHITNTNGCSSKIGKMYYQTGPQTLSLGSGCNQVGVILHELLHAVGFWHEQSRSDRDKYVRINWENILDGFADQFDKYGSQTIDDIGMDYDYKSIMHYSRKAFTKNGNPTIEAIHDPNMEFSNGNILSPKDIIEINALYDCKTIQFGWSSWSAYTPCDDNCYKSRQRYCYHSGNVHACGGNVNVYGIEKDTVKCPTTECPEPVNGHWGAWSAWTSCTVTCDVGAQKRSRNCNNPAPKNGGKNCVGDASESVTCVKRRCHLGADDTDFENNRMGIWSNSHSDEIDWIIHSGVTQTAYTGPSKDHTTGTGSYLYIESSSRVNGDSAKLVTHWMPYVAGGQCIKIAYNMYGSTVGSLTVRADYEGSGYSNILYKYGNQGQEWIIGMGSIDPPVVTRYKLTIEAKVGNTGYSDIAIDDVYIDPGLCSCQDEFVPCASWAASGECQKNSAWMSTHCKRSCNICTPACADSDATQCPLWAKAGECPKNAAWMKANCGKSCGFCVCQDIADTVQCPQWATAGECSRNPAWMKEYCAKSCRICV